MDARKQIAYGILKVVLETLVTLALQRATRIPEGARYKANRIPLALNGIIKNGHGSMYVCPYGDSHKFSHETDMLLHVMNVHPHSDIAKGLKTKVIIN